MLAAYHGQLALVDALIEAGADVNSIDGSGNTILMGVAFKGHSAVVLKLLEVGADQSARNPLGQTALAYAQLFGRVEAARLLCDFSTGEVRSFFPGKNTDFAGKKRPDLRPRPFTWGQRLWLLILLAKALWLEKFHFCFPVKRNKRSGL